MPRDKRGEASRGKSPRGGKGGRGGRGGRGASRLDTSFIPFAGMSRGDHSGFSLQEEARNTERHAFWDSDHKLRHSKVNFVSAVTAESSKPTEHPEAALADMTLESPPNALEIEVLVEENMNDTLQSTGARTPSPVETTLKTFIVDTQGSQAVHTGLRHALLRSVSPTPSDSSEEVILFHGRNNKGKSRTFADPIDTKIRVVDDKIREKKELLEETLHAKTNDLGSANFEAILPKKRDQTQRQGRPHRRSFRQEEEEALIADYISNIDGGEVASGILSFSQRELGGIVEQDWQDKPKTSPGQPPKDSKHSAQGGWDRSDICDLDAMSTSDGVVGEVQAIFSKRERESGLQYLVVWQDQTVDEARWVPASTLTSLAAISQIEDFEAEETLVAKFQHDDEESTESEDMDDDDDDDEGDEDDNEGDEDDLVQRKIERMTDEQIARLLGKQEELGMGSDELQIFDGAADADEDEAFAIPTFTPFKPQTKDRRSKRPRGDFPAAAALADAYDGFDVMDFDRPSLKKKPKGRKGKLAFDLSDSELEASMQMAWDNDRIKKKERKQEREELRAQGLLGSKNGKPDLKQKYKEGMSFQAIKEEIKTFLMGDNTTLALPPMDKEDRKVVHEIANAFNLKSKSAGAGRTRFPVLYRTKRTSVYVERIFDAVEARLTRRFLPRMDVGGKRSTPKRSGRAGGGAGFNNAAVSYRDGDIVGGSAPELGIENKGRAMLEKMGWSTGTALGAINNKGILQPVSHVVKTTKAGLG